LASHLSRPPPKFAPNIVLDTLYIVRQLILPYFLVVLLT